MVFLPSNIKLFTNLATLISPNFGSGVSLPCFLGVFFLIAVYTGAPFYVLLIGCLLEGVSGSHLTFLGCTHAYVADSTTAQQRSFRFVVIALAITVGAACAHLLVGYLIDIAGHVTVFWTFFAVQTVNSLYIIICIPETEPTDQPAETSCDVSADEQQQQVPISRRRSSLSEIRDTLKESSSNAIKIFVRKPAQSELKTNRRLKLALLLSAFIIQACVELGKASVDNLFLLGYPICFTSITLGFYEAIAGLSRGFFAVIAVRLMTKRLSDVTIVLFGGFSYLLSRLVFAFASTWQDIALSRSALLT